MHGGVGTGQDTDLLVPLLLGESFVGEGDEGSIKVFQTEFVPEEKGGSVQQSFSLRERR